jgi:hypothetical protein
MLLPLRSLFVALNRTRNYKILHESPSEYEYSVAKAGLNLKFGPSF